LVAILKIRVANLFSLPSFTRQAKQSTMGFLWFQTEWDLNWSTQWGKHGPVSLSPLLGHIAKETQTKPKKPFEWGFRKRVACGGG